MATNVRRITNISEAAYGVNILEQAPPTNVRGEQTNVVGIIMDTPWGPTDLTVIASTSEFFETFAPTAFDVLDNYPSLKALLNKRFPGPIEVKRVAVTSAAASTRDFADEDATASVTVTAKYNGVVGDLINVEWVTGSSGDATTATAIVTIGTSYTATYVDVVTATTTVTDPGDPFVTFAAHASIVKVPDVAAGPLALASGSDGTAVSADWTGVVGTDFEGVAAFTDANSTADVVFGAEVPSGFIDAFNTQLLAASASKSFFGVLSTPASQTRATAITYVASYRSDRAAYAWPRVTTTNFYDPTAPTVDVDGNAFKAAAIASVLPEVSPGGAPGRPFMYGITGLETSLTQGDYDLLFAAGINGFGAAAAGGYMARGGLTTSLTSGLTLINRRRMTDYIMESLANYFEGFVGELLDVDVTNNRFGNITGPEAGGCKTFMQQLKDDGRIRAFSIDFFSGSTPQIDNGQWPIVFNVKLYAPQQEIVLIGNVGQTVQIVET